MCHQDVSSPNNSDFACGLGKITAVSEISSHEECLNSSFFAWRHTAGLLTHLLKMVSGSLALLSVFGLKRIIQQASA